MPSAQPALTTLTATGATVTQSSTAKTTGALSYTGTSAINLGGSITTSGGVVTIALRPPLNAQHNPRVQQVDQRLNRRRTVFAFTRHLTRRANVALTGGQGPVLLRIRSSSAKSPLLTTLTATAATITQGSTAHTTGAISYTGTSAINLGGNVTTSGGVITMTGPANLTADATIDSTNAGGVAAGANISFTNTLNGAHNLTLNGGTGGTVLFSGAIGGTTPLTSLTATAATITQSSTAKTTGALSYTGTSAINLGGNITTSGGVVTMTGPTSLTANATVDTTNAGGTAAGVTLPSPAHRWRPQLNTHRRHQWYRLLWRRWQHYPSH